MTEQELRATVRTNIKRYREYRKWTQAQLAEKLEISVNFLSDIENGKKWISPASMVKFSVIFNIEPFELFKPAETPSPDVSVLLSRYNDEVVHSVSESLKQVYSYFQTFLEEKISSDKENPAIIEAPESSYNQSAFFHSSVAENEK